MKKKVYVHLKNNKFDIYGAGGAMVILINSIKKIKILEKYSIIRLQNNIKFFQEQILKSQKIKEVCMKNKFIHCQVTNFQNK